MEHDLVALVGGVQGVGACGVGWGTKRGVESDHRCVTVTHEPVGFFFLLTLGIKLRSIFAESFEKHLLPQQLQECGEGG